MKKSIQNLIQDFNAVVFGKDEYEFRVMSELKALLQLLAYQNSCKDFHLGYSETNIQVQEKSYRV